MTKIKIFTVFFFLVFIASSVSTSKLYAQDNSIDKREKELAKKKEAQQKKERKAIEKQQARHLKIQSKDTRKRMKVTKKKSREHADGKKEFYFSRFFKKRKR
ncbi:MAG: hypothetical protein V4667_03395 [Bacteroidota bacterium]